MTGNTHQDIEANDLMTGLHEEIMTERNPNIMDEDGINWESVESNIDIADHHSAVGSIMLPFLSFSPSIRWVVRLFGRIILYISKIVTIPQLHYNEAMINVVRGFRNGFKSIENHLKSAEDVLHQRQKWVDRKLLETDCQFEEMNERHQWTQVKFAEVENMARLNRVDLDHRFDDFARRVEEMKIKVDEQETTISNLRRDTSIQERRLATFFEETINEIPTNNRKSIQHPTGERDRLLDSLYIAFEDRFRGTPTEIMERMRIYLPYLENNRIGDKNAPILDIGCGRGEWLDLLKSEDFIAKGIDLNRTLVELNREKGLDVAEGDALQYLRSLPESCLGAITAFHLVEHLPFEVIVNLFDEANRVLLPDGVIIFETPNPENILVGACHFYADPTHRAPLPDYAFKFIAEYRGFIDVEILKLHPFPEELKLCGSDLAERFSELFYGPRDYSLIGFRSRM